MHVAGLNKTVVGTASLFPQQSAASKPTSFLQDQSAAVAELGVAALKALQAQEVMEMAVEAVAQVMDHEMCKVLELLPDERALLLRAGVGWKEGLVGHGTVSAGLESQAGYTLMEGRPVVVEDLPNETRFSGPPLLHNHGVVSGLSTPIYTKAGPWGVIGTHSKSPRTYSKHDEDFLVAVANIIGASIEREQHEQELRVARSRLQQLDQLRAQVLFSVAHELRTPLTPLRMQLQGLQQILRQSHDTEAVARGLEVAARSAARLGELVEDLVELTRLQADNVEIQRRRLDLATIVEEAADAYQFLAKRREVTLTTTTQAVEVEGDASRLYQVIAILLDNAIRFNEQSGNVHIAVKKEGDFGAVYVEDSGVGLTSEQMATLFQPMSPGSRSDTRTGLGFGLFLAKEIVERHGGRIGARSAGPGKGSVFWFRIRLIEGARMTEEA